MLRFFRQIRQRYLTENRFSKYLLYAVGEILLVVIGILIALQIDNWNEARKARIQEIKIYKEIHNDLQVTLGEIKHDMESHQNLLKSTQYLIDHIAGQRPYSDSVLPALFNTLGDLQVVPKSSGFEALNSIGLDLLSNDSVRIKITDIYQLRLKRVVEAGWRETPSRDLNAIIQPYIDKYVRNDIEAGRVRNVDYLLDSMAMYPTKINNYEAFLKDDAMFGALSKSLFQRSGKIRIHYITAREIEDALLTIEKELERLEPTR